MKKIFLAAICALLAAAAPVYADADRYAVKSNGDNIVISGTLDKAAAYVTLELLEEGYSFGQDLPDNINKSDAIAFLQQQELSGNTLDFEFEFPCDGASRKLNASLNGEGFSAPLRFTVNYVKSSDFNAVYAELKNNLSTKENFISFLETGNNAMILKCDELPAEADAEKVREIMYNSLKAVASEVKSADDTGLMWRQSTLISLLNEGKVTNIKKYANYLNLSDTSVLTWYNHTVGQTGGAEKLTNLLGTSRHATCTEFETTLKKALVLTVVRYPNGAANIGKVLNDFVSVTGISQTGERDKYSAFAGKDYIDFDVFLNAFKQYSTNANNSSGGSGGGSSGSSKSGSVIPGITAGTNAQETVGMKFIDLDTVPWAYKAIATLADKKIISGKSDDRFAPDNPITREEFAKLCVCMMQMDNRSYENRFSDAAEDKWYTKYINIAFDAGICTGIGDGVFGVGMPITRQDMAVMLYNMLKMSGVQTDTTPPAFDDWNDVSAYAHDAVAALVNKGVISGMGDNTFAPNSAATRAQAAVMLFGMTDSIR